MKKKKKKRKAEPIKEKLRDADGREQNKSTGNKKKKKKSDHHTSIRRNKQNDKGNLKSRGGRDKAGPERRMTRKRNPSGSFLNHFR